MSESQSSNFWIQSVLVFLNTNIEFRCLSLQRYVRSNLTFESYSFSSYCTSIFLGSNHPRFSNFAPSMVVYNGQIRTTVRSKSNILVLDFYRNVLPYIFALHLNPRCFYVAPAGSFWSVASAQITFSRPVWTIVLPVKFSTSLAWVTGQIRLLLRFFRKVWLSLDCWESKMFCNFVPF